MWILVVAQTEMREDYQGLGGGDMIKYTDRKYYNSEINKIRSKTGCIIVLHEAEPLYRRPKPFYYIVGPSTGVYQATFMLQRLMCEVLLGKIDNLNRKLEYANN